MHTMSRFTYVTALLMTVFPFACAGVVDESEPALGEAAGAVNGNFFSDPQITAPGDGAFVDGNVNVCINSPQASACDYQLSGQPGAVVLPLIGSIAIQAQSYVFAEDRINDLRVAGGGGYVSLKLTNPGPGCDLDPVSGTLRVDMNQFWKSVTLSADKKTLSWDMSGANIAVFDSGGCPQVDAPVDLTMLLRLPVQQSNGKYDTKFVTITTIPPSGQPDPYRFQLSPIRMTSDAPQPGSLDFAFVIDTTGSMWDDIDAVKSSSIELVDAIFKDAPDARVAIIDYKDFPQSPYGGWGDYPYHLVLDFSSDHAQVVGALQDLVVGGGGDNPEAVYSGVMAAITRSTDFQGHALGAWRSGAKKALLVLGDAPPHDPEPVTGYTLQTVQDAAAAVGGLPGLPGSPVQGNALPQGGGANAAGGGIAIYTLQIGYDPTAKSFFEGLSGGTGGQSFTAGNAVAVVPAIREIIGTVTDDSTPTNRPPETRWASPSIDRIFPANHQMVNIDILGVTDPDGDPITMEITKITKDEPSKGPQPPDATGVGTAHAAVRAERAGNGGGRVYRIEFTARDSFGAEATGAVSVCVPHDQGENTFCDDNSQLYDATAP